MEYFQILCEMGEFQEFAEALFGQLSVEIDEEKEIIELAIKAKDDIANKVQFKEIGEIANEILPDFKNRVEEFRKRRGVDTLKRADRLLNALKHVQTANTHEKNTCIGILKAAVSNYKNNPTWELCKNLMNYDFSDESG